MRSVASPCLHLDPFDLDSHVPAECILSLPPDLSLSRAQSRPLAFAVEHPMQTTACHIMLCSPQAAAFRGTRADPLGSAAKVQRRPTERDVERGAPLAADRLSSVAQLCSAATRLDDFCTKPASSTHPALTPICDPGSLSPQPTDCSKRLAATGHSILHSVLAASPPLDLSAPTERPSTPKRRMPFCIQYRTWFRAGTNRSTRCEQVRPIVPPAADLPLICVELISISKPETSVPQRQPNAMWPFDVTNIIRARCFQRFAGPLARAPPAGPTRGNRVHSLRAPHRNHTFAEGLVWLLCFRRRRCPCVVGSRNRAAVAHVW